MLAPRQRARPEQPARDRLPGQSRAPERDSNLPPEFQHSLLWAKEGPRFPVSTRAQEAMAAAQATAGNAAVQGALGKPVPAGPPGPAPEAKPVAEADEKGRGGEAAPVEPMAPAAPSPDAAPTPAPKPPTTAPPPQPLWAAEAPPPAGGGPVTPQALQSQARQVGQQITRGTGGGGGAGGGVAEPQQVAAPQPVARAGRRQVQNLSGRPPALRAVPKQQEVPDPIPEATKRIEGAANRTLADQTLPPVTASPGGHVPDVASKPLTKEQRRFLLLGEKAMAAAELPEEERAKVREVRDRILAPPPVGDDGQPVKVELPPAQTIRLTPLPPAELTLGERDLFTAALAQLLAEPQADAQAILDGLKETSEKFPGNALLNPYYKDAFEPIGKSKLPDIEKGIRDAAQPMAEAIGVAGKILDDAVAERKAQLELERKKAAGELQQQADAARQTAADNASVRATDAAKAKAVAADAKQRAAAAKKKLKPTFREIADTAAARIKDKVAEAIARFQLMETERGKALDDARSRQIEAYRDAATADQLVTAVANKVGPDQTPSSDPDEQRRARERVSKAINAAKAWVDARAKQLDTEIKRLKAETAADIKADITAVEDEGAAAFRDLKAWGDAQDGAVDTWWQDNARNLESWADKAHETATTWALVQGKLARLQMQRDLEAVRASVETQLVTEGEQAEQFFKMAADKRQRFVDMVVTSETNRPDIAKGLAAGVRQRVTAAERPDVEAAFMADALALPESQWAAMEALAQSKDPSFKADVRSDTIYKSGVDKIGTDEKAIFDALTGLTPLELAAVKAHYATFHGDMYSDLDSEMSGDEWRRAKALMAGNRGIAAAEAIHDAVWGPGTNEKQIMDALRGLSADERKAAEDYYQSQYDESLSSRLEGDLSGSELGQAKALLAGKIEEADAYQIDAGLRGGVFSPDRDNVSAVYDRVQQESLARAKAEGWTSAELDAEISRRNAEIENKFGEKFAGVPAYSWGGSQSTLRTAITAAYPFDPANRKLINALADNDMVTADAALMQTEREGVYADDSVLKGVIRKQYDRAFDRTQLDLGPETSQGVDRKLEAWEKAEDARRKKEKLPPLTPRERIDKRMAFQREADTKIQDEAFDRAHASSKMLDAVLQANHGITLQAMIDQNMSFGDRREALAQLEVLSRTPTSSADRRERRLDWAYNRVRYAIEGVGTDMDELKGGLSGLTKEEIDYLDERWRKDHDGETLKGAVQSDTSGREEDDLVDTVEHGAPQTVAERMAELRRRHERDEASVGFLGAAASKAESRRSKAALAEMEALSKDLDNPDLDPRKREFLSREVDRRIDHADAAIEAQRAAVDSLADNLTTIFQYVVGAIAVIVGAIVAVVSGGTAIPALIAIAGSIIGTLGSMGIKAAVKGGAYGAEEFGTDLVVGAVDLVVTIATAGSVKGGNLLAAAKAELKELGKATIRVGLRQAARKSAAMAVKEAAEVAAEGSFARRALGFVGRNVKAIAKNQGYQFATALPTALVANIMNERNLRSGNPLKNIAHGTLDAAIENLKVGAVMGGFGHAVQAGLGRVIQVQHPPKSPVETRLAEYKAWSEKNPGKSRADYVAETEARAATAARDAEVARLETRAARKALLESITPAERGGFADVPIVRVSEAEFKALNRGQPGDAMIFKKDGQVALVIREGAPPSAVAAHAATLRETVAPGTAGRTVNPAEALPPRLQNRVPVDVVHDPTLGLDGVRVVPMDPDGVIRGVRLEVGPNARAVDIQNHVATIDAVRKFEGLAGRARQAALDVAAKLGADVISPRERGRWEAALEVKKLKEIIDERMQRLAEEGTDARRAAAIAEEVAGLAAQLDRELVRLQLGAEADARGYIAAVGPKKARKGTEAPLDRKAEAARRRAQRLQIELGETTAKLQAVEKERNQLSQPVDQIVQALEARIEELRGARTGAPPRLQAIVEQLQSGQRVAGLQALREWLGKKPAEPPRAGQPKSFAEGLRELVDTAERIEPRRAAREAQLDAEVAAIDKQILATKAKIAKGKYNRFAGDGLVPIHPSLPEPLAGRDYFPRAPEDAVLSPGEQQALLNNQMGFTSELRLANRIAEAGGVVIQYGHKITEHGADIISIDPATGKVTLWDSKYHTVPSTGHSDTFDVTGRREEAVKRALKYLNEGKDQLPPALRKQAIDALTEGTFDAVTSHTTGGSFTDRTIKFERGAEISRD